MLGNGRLEATCIDGIKRLCHIRGKMRKKVWVNTVGSFCVQMLCVLSMCLLCGQRINDSAICRVTLSLLDCVTIRTRRQMSSSSRHLPASSFYACHSASKCSCP